MLIDTYNAHRDDVWLATQTELYEYVEAVNGLKVSDAKIINDSEVDVYVRIDSEYVTVPAKGSASL